MNLPNKLTLLRVILTPIFLLAMVIKFPCHYLLALVIFIVASLTDYFDGKIARERNLVTDFGKFVDPIADKMLTTAAFLGFFKIGLGIGMEWALFIILFREFAIASMRLVAVSGAEKKVIPANIWGKLKTVFQMVTVIFGLTCLAAANLFTLPLVLLKAFDIAFNVMLWISVLLTALSGVIYIKDGFKFIDTTK